MTEQFDHPMLSNIFNKHAIYTDYQRIFSVVKADTHALCEKAFRLRYDVYCTENAFKDMADNPDSLEKDTYDTNAVNFLLSYNKTKEMVGTARLILPNKNNLERSFPMQKLCTHPLLHHEDKISELCQISRMCMSAKFRRRKEDGSVLPAYFERENKTGTKDGNLIFIRRRIPYAPLGLFSAAFETALKKGVMDCLFFVEQQQLKSFSNLGISFNILGPAIENHGMQHPVIFNIKQVLDNMLIDNPPCWDVLSDKGRIHQMANEIFFEKCHNGLLDAPSWQSIHSDAL